MKTMEPANHINTGQTVLLWINFFSTDMVVSSQQQ